MFIYENSQSKWTIIYVYIKTLTTTFFSFKWILIDKYEQIKINIHHIVLCLKKIVNPLYFFNIVSQYLKSKSL